MITALTGSNLGIYHNENYVLSEWNENGRVVFSATRQGNALFCHFSSEKKSLKSTRKAILEYICFVFDTCPWCEMIISQVNKKSVSKLIKSLGFIDVAEYSDGNHLFMRLRNG